MDPIALLTNPVFVSMLVGAGTAIWHKLFTDGKAQDTAKLDAAVSAASAVMDMLVSTARAGMDLKEMYDALKGAAAVQLGRASIKLDDELAQTRMDVLVMQHVNTYIEKLVFVWKGETSISSADLKANHAALHADVKAIITAYDPGLIANPSKPQRTFAQAASDGEQPPSMGGPVITGP